MVAAFVEVVDRKNGWLRGPAIIRIVFSAAILGTDPARSVTSVWTCGGNAKL
jgi:hypothetical protein